MSTLHKVRLGRTAARVTPLGMGTAQLGWLFAPVTHADAEATLQRAHALGLRYFDTSPLYGRGVAETRLGRALKSWDRASVTISTKVGFAIYPEDVVPDGESQTPIENRGRDYSYDGAMRLIEGSLKRIGADYLDIVLIHDPEDHMQEAIDGTYRALSRLRSEGVIKAVGAGMNFADKLLWLANHGQFDCFLCAGRYTLLDQIALDALLPECDKQGIGIMIGGPYNSGLLANPYAPNATFNYDAAGRAWVEKAQKIDAVCKAHGVSIQAAALQFPLAHPAVDTVLTGARSVSEINQNHTAFTAAVPVALWADLKRQGLLREDAPVAI